MLTAISSPGATKLLYVGNALWFTSAFIHFGFRQPFMMRKLSLRKRDTDPSIRALPEGDSWHHDIMSYLGGMNTSLAVLALLRLYALVRPSRLFGKEDVSQDVTALIVLGVANCSQAILNFVIGGKHDRWICGKGLDRITVLDAVFTVLDWSAALGKIMAI
ncbi:hypothetical protein F5Y18DRAFT_108780 [Xylariaceae sp. FL1019]|nr:hypothetical protein F5Y18DRAFT_108780 [Xylariaceae sp. FL1019]